VVSYARCALLGDLRQEFVHFLFKVHVENTISFVHDQELDRLQVEPPRVLKVVDDPPGRC
jgi:hypothetical protein